MTVWKQEHACLRGAAGFSPQKHQKVCVVSLFKEERVSGAGELDEDGDVNVGTETLRH